MPSRTAQVGYRQETLPGDVKVPVLWWFELRDAQGNQVGAEQTYTVPTASITVTGPAGHYIVRGGQRDETGAELGVAVESAPFDFLGDVQASFVATITLG